MGLILPVLVALLLAGFYAHDSALMQAEVCELAAMGDNLRLEVGRESLLESRLQALTTGRFAWSRQVGGRVGAGEEQVSARMQGSFPLPGLILRYWKKGEAHPGAAWEMTIFRPTRTIRRIRGVKELVELGKE